MGERRVTSPICRVSNIISCRPFESRVNIYESVNSHLLLVGLVAADGLASVEVAVDSGVGLVQHVGLVGAGGIGRWARAGADVRCASSAGSTTVVAVTVNSRVGNIRGLGAVSAMGARGVIVTSRASASVGASASKTSSVAGRTDTGVGASRADASGVAGGTDAGVSASRANASGVTS